MHEGTRKSRLQHLLRRADGRSLVTLTAATGWGKTHLARLWAETTGATLIVFPPREVDENSPLTARRGPDQTTTTLAETITSSNADNWLILDGIDHLSPSAEAKLSQWLDHEHRPTLLTGSRPPDHFTGGRWALELGAHHLQLDLAEVSAWLRQDLGDDAPAARVLSVTHGWPAAVQVVIDELHDHAADERLNLVHRTTRPQGRLGRFFRTAMANLEAAQQRALVVLALLGPTAEPHLATLIPNAGTVLPGLTRAGWVLTDPQTTLLTPLPGMLELLHSPDQIDQEQYATLVDDIVDHQLGHDPAAAMITLTRHRRPTRLADVLARHGDALLRAGEFTALCTAADSLSGQGLDPDITRTYAHALAYRGNWREALRHLEPILHDGPLPAALALALGHVHHFRGATTEALAAYERAVPAQSTAWAEILGWRSGAHWLLGQAEPAHRLAHQAHEAATTIGSDSGLAVAHTALAMVALRDGDWHGNGEHYALALAAAERAGDQPARARILTNLGSRHIENGEYGIGRELTEQAISLAEEQGFAMVSALARCNRAEVFLRMGVIDGAVADAEISRDAYARFGSPAEAYAHCILGDARREQGRLIQARIAYERALDLAQESGDRQSKTHALIGLSRTLADTDPSRAREAAERAVKVDPGVMAVEARLSKAWVDLALGEADEAVAAADAAWEESRVRDNRAGLAEAATLRAVADDDPVPGLREAAHLWREVNAHVNATRVELGLARRTEPGSVAAMSLTNELSEAGCSPQGGTFVDRLITGTEHLPPLVIRALGTFSIERDGKPVPHSQWRSGKARDLLKILIVHHDQLLTREEAADLLWPEAPYRDVSGRLSVALSLLRSTLGRDVESPIVAEGQRIGLNSDALDLDVIRFHRSAHAGLDLAIRDGTAAIEPLKLAVQAYEGDLLEEDRYATWIDEAREHLRGLYISATRALAGLLEEQEPQHALLLWLRVLDKDPYDEGVHHDICRVLIDSGRHGEALRRHRVYSDRMAELDLPALPLSDIRLMRPA